ncbi:hypothetical protein [Pectobacterium versatile]|uniref:hypothetical protein n=1 Tax=Pectobacterium versatile TaxID=2488639 RepID=UPI0020BE444E|nr:hypothetical protein [Pectobacterium versatile]
MEAGTNKASKYEVALLATMIRGKEVHMFSSPALVTGEIITLLDIDESMRISSPFIAHTFHIDYSLTPLTQTFSITTHSAQLIAHFLVEITFCAMDAVFSRGLRNFLLKFCLGEI